MMSSAEGFRDLRLELNGGVALRLRSTLASLQRDMIAGTGRWCRYLYITGPFRAYRSSIFRSLVRDYNVVTYRNKQSSP